MRTLGNSGFVSECLFRRVDVYSIELKLNVVYNFHDGCKLINEDFPFGAVVKCY